MNIAGYGVRIRALDQEDVDRWNINLDGNNLSRCVAVDGVDLGACLAAVVCVADRPRLLWSDADGNGAPITDVTFPDAVQSILAAVLPAEIQCV